MLASADLFKEIGLAAPERYSWDDMRLRAPDEPGVYVISVDDPGGVRLGPPLKGCAPEEHMAKARSLWRADQPIVYIGRASKSLRKRLSQFYSHKYGNRSPHAGGQSILLLKAPLWIHCATASDPAAVEHQLISRFEAVCNRKPFGNKVKGAAVKTAATLG